MLNGQENPTKKLCVSKCGTRLIKSNQGKGMPHFYIDQGHKDLLTFKSSGTSELAFSLMVKEALVCMTAAAHYILGLAVSMEK